MTHKVEMSDELYLKINAVRIFHRLANLSAALEMHMKTIEENNKKLIAENERLLHDGLRVRK